MQITVIRAEELASWRGQDEWLSHVAGLLTDTAHECVGEPAVGMWALRDGDAVIGCVGIRRRRTNGRLELCRLHVRPEYRGRGLSRRLIFHALSHAHSHSEERVTAQVREDNAPAFRALSGFGFREISRHVREADGKTILLLEETREIEPYDMHL
jgi:ribosomal protein S18 acetylase RimI-like enzyme